jgi:hypothetical protein
MKKKPMIFSAPPTLPARMRMALPLSGRVHQNPVDPSFEGYHLEKRLPNRASAQKIKL